MKPIADILVPLDFSGASRSASRTPAVSLTSAAHRCTCCTRSRCRSFPAAASRSACPTSNCSSSCRTTGGKLLNEALTDEEKRRYHAVLVQRSGPAVKEILGYVRERGDIDLIVMATHGRGGMSRLMLGSVADHVVREAPCPVLTLRDPARAVSKAA